MVKPFATGREPSLVRQTSEKLPPLDPPPPDSDSANGFFGLFFFLLLGPTVERKGHYIETRACLGSFGNG